ncbi:hypothetical protein Bca4012_020427 [Brassica carinata]|uniref:Uncharacterized protein n=1 Tax=Brassica carinata TaxID=52824 RepID=A0A8X7WFM4_BRACI|nr:hypothetical protein Bca52824_001213 [Brassica carinata]
MAIRCATVLQVTTLCSRRSRGAKPRRLQQSQFFFFDVSFILPHELLDFTDGHACTEESVGSVLERFQDLNLDDSVDSAPKDVDLIGLFRQVQDLKRQVKERIEWAQEKAMQAEA